MLPAGAGRRAGRPGPGRTVWDRIRARAAGCGGAQPRDLTLFVGLRFWAGVLDGLGQGALFGTASALGPLTVEARSPASWP